MRDFKMYIDGRPTEGALSMDVINPATWQIIAQCPRADATQLCAAVAAAKRAFPGWSRTDIEERCRLISKIVDALESRQSEFARLLTAEQGKPLDQAAGEIAGAIATARGLLTLRMQTKTVLKDNETEKVIEHRTPLGVVAAITPWNFPLVLLIQKVVPALMTGNTVVAKPAATTPPTSLLFGEICNEYLPAGVLNMITDANDLGSMLTSHPDIAKIAFTGSTATGKKVMESAASSIKRFTLELGGNDAAIVLDDVDVPEAARNIFDAAMINAGQLCVAAKRVYVHESQYDEMCHELATLADATIVDNGMKQGTQLGPIQNRAQYEKVKALIEDARSKGKIIAGGEFGDGPGFFIRPTIVRDIDDDARLVWEEQFGPVLPVMSYRSIDEVIQRANDT